MAAALYIFYPPVVTGGACWSIVASKDLKQYLKSFLHFTFIIFLANSKLYSHNIMHRGGQGQFYKTLFNPGEQDLGMDES
jgi:hypothetical protein